MVEKLNLGLPKDVTVTKYTGIDALDALDSTTICVIQFSKWYDEMKVLNNAIFAVISKMKEEGLHLVSHSVLHSMAMFPNGFIQCYESFHLIFE